MLFKLFRKNQLINNKKSISNKDNALIIIVSGKHINYLMSIKINKYFESTKYLLILSTVL